MFWVIVYHLLRGNGRSPCVTPQPAEPVDAPATTATTSAREAAATSVVTASDDVDARELTDSPTRQDIVDALNYHNDTAKAMRRQGYTQTAAAPYARIHHAIDLLLSELEGTP